MENGSNKILIIDDQEANLLVLSTMLSDLLDGTTVITADSGKLGLKLAESDQPDVILLDVMMPELDGFETCKALKSNKKTAHIPIIMLTAIKTDSQSYTKGLELGADAFLSKPVDETELIAQVKVMRRIKKAEDQLRREKNYFRHLVDIKTNELRDFEENYKIVIDTCPDGFTTTDLTGKYLDANPAFLEMLGYSLEEIKQKTLLDITPESFHEENKAIMSDALQKRTNLRFSKEYRRKDGSHVPVALSSWAMRDKDGNPTLFCNFIQDITEQKQAENERILLASALEQTVESIIITDNTGMIIYVNPAFETTSGYSRIDAIGEKLDILSSDSSDKEFYDQLWSSLNDGKNWSGIVVSKKKDGTLFEEEMTISPIRSLAGRVTNFVAVKSDITREKQLERQLLQAQKMEALGTLAGGIAHDFNNVLHGLSMSAHTMQKKLPDDTPLKKYLDRMSVFCERGAGLVKQILTFSRQVEQDFSIIQVSHIVKEVLVMMRSALPSTITIEQHISKNAGNISGNFTQIHQVVMNLCTNAGYAMRDSGGVLRVSLENKYLTSQSAWSRGMQEGEYLYLSISDSGIGMPPSIQERIFEPFFTTKPKGEGTGLGLSVVHGIIKAHSGHVWVQSEVHKGTSFDIYFPLVSGEANYTRTVQSQAIKGTEKILLVDDEKTMVDLLKSLLTDLGYSVTVAHNGKEALDLFNANQDQFDLVLTDQTMPEVTGDELAKILLEKRPELPVVIMTGFSYKLDKSKATDIGIKKILMKPFDMNHLGSTLRSILDKKRLF